MRADWRDYAANWVADRRRSRVAVIVASCCPDRRGRYPTLAEAYVVPSIGLVLVPDWMWTGPLVPPIADRAAVAERRYEDAWPVLVNGEAEDPLARCPLCDRELIVDLDEVREALRRYQRTGRQGRIVLAPVPD